MALDQTDDAEIANRLADLADASDWDGLLALARQHMGANRAGQGLFLQAAVLLRKADRTDQAEACLQEGVARWPDDLRLAHNRADLATRHCDFDEVAARWETVITLNPEWPVGPTELADLHRRSGREDTAAELFGQANNRFPAYIWAAHGHAISPTRRHDWPEAARRWADVSAKFPAHQPAHEEFARALIESGNMRDAAEAVSRGLAAFPGSERLTALGRRLPEATPTVQPAPIPPEIRTGAAKPGKRARRRMRAR